jgi:hypothetical protein
MSESPGNVFAFNIIEDLVAGAHVITAPMGLLEREIEYGITCMPDNQAETVAATLKPAIEGQRYESAAAQSALQA